jgi:hypothetical protein
VSLPDAISNATRAAIETIGDLHWYQEFESESHFALVLGGFAESTRGRRAIARYLVGLRASAIDAALNIRSELEDTPEDQQEILESVYAIVGESNDDLTQEQKEDERNPWIAEGIWHLCMAVAYDRTRLHPVGQIVALFYPHISAKEHGLDVATIYEKSGALGVSLVESKAYKSRPNAALSSAVGFFRQVDDGTHDVRIRQVVQIMRTALPPRRQRAVSGSFWKRERSYIPNPHYDAAVRKDWSKKRDSLTDLVPDRNHILIMPHAITDFDQFFDDIANEMRAFVESL